MAIVCLAPASAPGAGAGEYDNDPSTVRVVVTSFPVWLFTRNLLMGLSQFEIDPVIPAGDACVHELAYTPAEQRRILSANYIVVAGLGQNAAVDALLDDLPREVRQPLRIDASERPGAPNWIPERLPEAFDGRAAPSGRAFVQRPNPHYFVSPLEAALTVESLARSFKSLPGMGSARNRLVLEGNRDRYVDALRRLAEEMREAVVGFGNRRIATQHDAFAYFARDLGLRVVAVLGEHPGHEIAPAQLRTLFQRVVQRGAGAVFLEPGADEALARNAEQSTRLPVGTLDPVAAGALSAPLDHYQAVMLRNLSVLSELLADAPPPDPNSDPEPPPPPRPPRKPRADAKRDAEADGAAAAPEAIGDGAAADAGKSSGRPAPAPVTAPVTDEPAPARGLRTEPRP